LCGDDISVEFQTFVGLILSRLPLDEVVLALELPPQGDVEIIGKFHIAVDIMCDMQISDDFTLVSLFKFIFSLLPMQCTFFFLNPGGGKYERTVSRVCGNMCSVNIRCTQSSTENYNSPMFFIFL
jgi:hypothetical protein